MTATLRTGKDVDLFEVGALHFRSRADAYAHILSAEALESPSGDALGAWWSERWTWESDTHRLTVAEQDGRLAGFSYVGPSEVEGAAELYAIHVDPELVGSGIGKLLMVDALDRLAEIGDRAVLWVLEENTVARRFYDRGGWRPDGVTRVEPISGVPVPQLRYGRELTRPGDSHAARTLPLDV
ncbi:GNAT family N-acetyltransferase [Paractinoplanes durhamensis]|uniref:N-acetyltransferase n=1 Tax=Paractinoplanes durhamensis TaxID=113563 RepID=A0ABQ3ZCY6_9ACTN|nr:GNAT family N-acetyltransferase [Actinoplanes durhamensis]GIE07665.1 N-acetyltransferase [Actinoplanes durhamensis]